MTSRLLSLPALGLILIGFSAPSVSAEEDPSAETVMATVNGTEITLGHMLVLRSGLPAQYAQVPADRLFEGILNQLVQQELLAQSQEDGPSPQVRMMIENERRALIASEEIGKLMDDAVTPEAVEAAYEERFLQADPSTEYSAAHILVETKEEAEDLLNKLNEGADFAALAREFSTGPSGPGGGDLGWFGEGVMVAPFFDAVVELGVGDISPPVQTDFGWHLIMLKETRSEDRPELEAVRAELEQALRSDALEAHVDRLEKLADVDRTNLLEFDLSIINDPSLLEQ